MSPIDIVFILFAVFGFYKGFKNGILIEVTTLMALILGFYGAQHLCSFTAKFLNETLQWNPAQGYQISLVISFVLIVVAVYLLGKMLTKVASMILLGGVNKILGGLFGVLKISVIFGVLLAYGQTYFDLLSWLPESSIESSLGIKPLESLGNFLLEEVFISENLNKIKAAF